MHVDKSFKKIQARVNPPPPNQAMPVFWELLEWQPIPNLSMHPMFCCRKGEDFGDIKGHFLPSGGTFKTCPSKKKLLHVGYTIYMPYRESWGCELFFFFSKSIFMKHPTGQHSQFLQCFDKIGVLL